MRLRYVQVLLAGAALLVGAGAGVAAAAPTPVALSITLADGVTQVASGKTVTYTAAVTNGGSAKVTGKLVLTVPTYVKLGHAGNGGKVVKHDLTWTVTLPAGRTVKRSATARIGTIPKGELRVTALASLFRGTSTKGVPVIRTADADRIAGVVDPAPAAPRSSAAPSRAPAAHNSSSGGTNLWAAVGIPLAVVLAGGAGLAAWLRRRRRGTPADPQDGDLVAAGRD